MSDELDVRAKVTLEADEAASVKQIKSQIPNIENGLKNTRVKVPVEADVTNTVQQVQQAVKNATSSLKTGKTIIPIDAAFNINLKDTNAVQAEITRLIKQFTQNKGTLIDFKIKADGVNDANTVMLKYKNSAQETINTMLKLVDVTQDVNNPQFAWQVNSNVFEKNIAKYEQGLNKITEAERKASGSYWQGQFKESVAAMTSTNDELVRMSTYYSDMESAATKASKAQESASKNYWQGRFKDSVGDITAENSALKAMADYYKQVGKEADQAASSANKLRTIQQKAEGLKLDSTKSNFNLDWSLYDSAINTGNLKQAEVELQILQREFTNLGKAARAAMPDNVIENLPLKINDAATAARALANNFSALKSQGWTDQGGLVSQVETLKNSLIQLESAPVNQGTVGQFTKISDELHTLQNTYKSVVSDIRTEKIDIGAENIQIDLQKIRSNLVSMQKDWSAAMKNPAFVQRFKEMFAVIDSGTIKSGAQLTNFRKEVQRLSADIQAAGLDQKTLWGRLTQNLQKFASWFFVGGGVASAVRGLRDMGTAVKAIDLSMTELRKVTDETNAAYDKFLKNAAKRSVELATNLSDYVGSAADFARMGFSIPDSAALADATTIYYNVADGMDSMEQATQSIISTLKAYRLEASDATKVTDIFNEISNRFAVTSGGIGEGMQRAGAALATANTSLEKSVALWTAMNEVIQNDESSATSLRFIAQRMRNTAGELEDMGEDADGAAESITKLQQQIRELTGVDIMSDANNFRDVYDVLKDISGVWDDITDKDRADVIRLMAGTRQSAAFSALMQNFSSAESALQVALDSSGSAYKENLKWLDSIEAKQQKAQAAFQAFSNEILSSDLVKFTYDAETGILGFLTNLISSLDAIPVLATAAAAALSFKNVGQPKCRAAVGLPRQILHKRCTFLDVGTTRFKIKREAPTFLLVSGLNCQEGLSSQYNLQPAFVPARYQTAMSVTDVMICAKEVQRL